MLLYEQALGRLLDRVIDEMADDIHFVEVDIAASPDIAQNAGITSTPTVQVRFERRGGGGVGEGKVCLLFLGKSYIPGIEHEKNNKCCDSADCTPGFEPLQ